MQKSIDLFREFESVADVATERGLVEGTVYGHIARAVELGEISIDLVTKGIEEAELDRIRTEVAAATGAGTGIKGAHTSLQGTYDYGLLRCIAIDLKNAGHTPTETDDW